MKDIHKSSSRSPKAQISQVLCFKAKKAGFGLVVPTKITQGPCASVTWILRMARFRTRMDLSRTLLFPLVGIG